LIASKHPAQFFDGRIGLCEKPDSTFSPDALNADAEMAQAIRSGSLSLRAATPPVLFVIPALRIVRGML
jgi:hypothetical protein